MGCKQTAVEWLHPHSKFSHVEHFPDIITWVLDTWKRKGIHFTTTFQQTTSLGLRVWRCLLRGREQKNSQKMSSRVTSNPLWVWWNCYHHWVRELNVAMLTIANCMHSRSLHSHNRHHCQEHKTCRSCWSSRRSRHHSWWYKVDTGQESESRSNDNEMTEKTAQHSEYWAVKIEAGQNEAGFKSGARVFLPWFCLIERPTCICSHMSLFNVLQISCWRLCIKLRFFFWLWCRRSSCPVP